MGNQAHSHNPQEKMTLFAGREDLPANPTTEPDKNQAIRNPQ
jgi:hypothetical protein